jgi:uncharacterized protein
MSGSGALSRQAPWLVSGNGFINLQVVAKPGSARRRIIGRDSRGLLIALNSQPSKGQANAELTAFLADLLGAARSSVTIVRGRAARVKTVRIINPQANQVAALLRAYP